MSRDQRLEPIVHCLRRQRQQQRQHPYAPGFLRAHSPPRRRKGRPGPAGCRGWTPEEIHKAMGAGWDQTVSLPEPIVVHLRYWTAWVDRAGAVHFRDDIYQQDKRMDKALSVFLDEAEFP